MDGVLGQIMLFAGTFAPRNWAFCDGQLLAISEYQALYAIIGSYYGGDGRSTMGLPDLRGRVPVGVGRGPGLDTYLMSERGGFEKVILSYNQMPAHTHAVQSSFAGALTNVQASVIAKCNDQASGKGLQKTTDPTDAVWRATSDAAQTIYSKDAPNASMSPAAIEASFSADVAVQGQVILGQAGSSDPVSNMQPYLGMNYIICIDGLFPSRPN